MCFLLKALFEIFKVLQKVIVVQLTCLYHLCKFLKNLHAIAVYNFVSLKKQ